MASSTLANKNSDEKLHGYTQQERDEKLFLYACEGKVEKVEKWYKLGGNIHARVALGRTALIGAAANGSKSVCKFLIQHGAKINDRDNSGMTALILAAIHDFQSVVKVLLNYGADFRMRDKKGKTAFDYAKNNSVLLEMLVYFEKTAPNPQPVQMDFSPQELSAMRSNMADSGFGKNGYSNYYILENH
eukprot:CAMPEP_0184708576 /NCGR_PEP_ID=MMETSP0313-20130426/37849_1 /TAXON_ID=2792 /ORGANISM="Porphyridium aerugineum, Strain SAG 1380-2" /LENGTH=187 /DNA_ID=CAMNT_0027170173 /DNA_START=555 /DNA_END=1118 /DNA_ORIENTATION=+